MGLSPMSVCRRRPLLTVFESAEADSVIIGDYIAFPLLNRGCQAGIFVAVTSKICHVEIQKLTVRLTELITCM